MTDDQELTRRRALTFEQAEGSEPLPSQMALRTTTPEIRAQLWNAVHQLLVKDKRDVMYGPDQLVGTMAAVMRNYCVTRKAMMADEISSSFDWNVSIAKSHFTKDDYVQTYGFTQWLMRRLQDPQFAQYVANILKTQNGAYRVVEKDFTIVPIASEQEGNAVLQALADLRAGAISGARKHLLDAARFLTEGDYASSARESIHAVEAVVRSKTGKSKFSDAIRELDARDPMHNSFRVALEKLYGYSSDEEGVRHAILQAGAPKVTERDAMFMLSVCAAFITYVLSARPALSQR